MNFDRRITLYLVIIFTLLLIIVGLERSYIATRQLQKLYAQPASQN
ncbi:MAG TPA: hypothetical protein VLE72_03705 [Candidatus Saccharimonadales bacterium]|nr:hypothetical protein [Candidatus Saccharimonadales bacterium]